MKTRKFWLLTAAVLAVLGFIIFGIAFFAAKGDFMKLSTSKLVTNEHTVTEDFTSLTLTAKDARIEILPAKDGKVNVTCYEEENRRHAVSVKEDVLVIEVIDEKKWYEYIGFNLKTPRITVYLPEKEYKDLLIANKTGGIDIRGITAETLTASTSTGKIKIEDVRCQGSIVTDFSTGGTYLKNVTCESLSSRGGTGDVTLDTTLVRGKADMKTNTGDVTLLSSDAAELTIQTNTGDVEGTLLSPKIFIPKTNTGDVLVPETVTGGKCKITTNTGDIEITVTN